MEKRRKELYIPIYPEYYHFIPVVPACSRSKRSNIYQWPLKKIVYFKYWGKCISAVICSDRVCKVLGSISRKRTDIYTHAHMHTHKFQVIKYK
jgi:hypothetical protein